MPELVHFHFHSTPPPPPSLLCVFFLSANQENRESANYCQVASFQKRLSNICFYIKLTSMFLHIDQPHFQSEKSPTTSERHQDCFTDTEY